MLKKLIYENKQSDCGGLFYRADVSQYSTDKGFSLKINLNKLKRKSCEGCGECGFIEDDLQERLCNEVLPINMETVEHGKIYRLITTNWSIDWETGIVDDWDLELIEVEDKNEKS